MKFHIYKFTEAGVTDWICAPNKKEALGIYAGDPNSAEISRLTKEELKNSYITDPYNGFKIIESMEEYLKTAKHTELVATDNF
jgi:hypothetical protein